MPENHERYTENRLFRSKNTGLYSDALSRKLSLSIYIYIYIYIQRERKAPRPLPLPDRCESSRLETANQLKPPKIILLLFFPLNPPKLQTTTLLNPTP